MQGHKATSEVLDFKDLWGKQECQVVQEHVEHQEISDNPVLWANKEEQDYQDLAGRRVLRVHSEVLDQVVLLVRLAAQDLRDLLDHLDLLELQEWQELQELLETQVHQDLRDHRDRPAQQEESGQQGLKDHRDLRAQLARQVTLDWLAK